MSEPEVPVVPDTALPAPPVPGPRAPLTESSPQPSPTPEPTPPGPRGPDLATGLLVVTVLTLVTVLATGSVSLLVGWGPLGADDAADQVVGVTPHGAVDGAPPPQVLTVGVPAQVGAFTVAVTAVRGAPARWVAAGADAAPVRGAMLVRLRATFTGQGTGRPQQDLSVTLVARDGSRYAGVPCRPAVAEDDVGAVLRHQDSAVWSACVTAPEASTEGARLAVGPYGSQDDAEQVSWSLP